MHLKLLTGKMRIESNNFLVRVKVRDFFFFFFFRFCFWQQKILLRVKRIKPEVLCEVLKKVQLVVCLDLWLSEFLDKFCKEIVLFFFFMFCFLYVWQEL